MELEAEDSRIPILSIKTCTFEDFLYIDQNTFQSLQIFNSEYHPSKSNSNRYKEGNDLQ